MLDPISKTLSQILFLSNTNKKIEQKPEKSEYLWILKKPKGKKNLSASTRAYINNAKLLKQTLVNQELNAKISQSNKASYISMEPKNVEDRLCIIGRIIKLWTKAQEVIIYVMHSFTKNYLWHKSVVELYCLIGITIKQLRRKNRCASYLY